MAKTVLGTMARKSGMSARVTGLPEGLASTLTGKSPTGG
jgi:hypothetical protein